MRLSRSSWTIKAYQKFTGKYPEDLCDLGVEMGVLSLLLFFGVMVVMSVGAIAINCFYTLPKGLGAFSFWELGSCLVVGSLLIVGAKKGLKYQQKLKETFCLKIEVQE